jgi:hypothetical protein
MCTIRLGFCSQHEFPKFIWTNDQEKYTVDAPNQNVNKMLRHLDGETKEMMMLK